MNSAQSTSNSALRLPPGPRGLPILGSMLKLMGPEPAHIAISRLACQYGDVSLIHLGSIPTVVISHPEVMAEAFAKNELSGRFLNEVFAIMTKEESVFHADYGEYWKDLSEFTKRQLWSAEDVEILSKKHFEPAIDAIADRMCLMADSGEPVKVQEVLTEGDFDLTFRTLFGWQENETDEFRQWKEALRERMAWFNAAGVVPNPADFLPWVKILPRRRLREGRRQRDARDRIMSDLVDSVHKRRAASLPATTGLVDIMLDKEEAGEISRGAIHALCMEVVGAVSPGVAATTSWFLLIVANRPEVQAKIHEELDRVIGRNGPPPTAEDRMRLPYTFACVAESMRYRTIAPFGIPHRAMQDTKIGGYRIPEGVQVFGNIYSVCHDARFWDSPDEFIPERFLPEADGSPPSALSSPAYVPFGIGVRRCTGDHFALGAFWLHVVRIMHRLRLETPEGVPLSEDEVFALSIEPKPHVLKAIRR